MREIELKYIVDAPQGHVDVDMTLLRLFGVYGDAYEVGSDLDVYFRASGVDFIRLREHHNTAGVGGGELTVKKSDKGDNVDRLEINVPLKSYRKGFDFCKLMYGQPAGFVEKTYSKFRLGGEIEVSTYSVDGDARIFLEVEGPTLKDISAISDRLQTQLKLIREERSIYQLFIEGSKS